MGEILFNTKFFNDSSSMSATDNGKFNLRRCPEQFVRSCCKVSVFKYAGRSIKNHRACFFKNLNKSRNRIHTQVEHRCIFRNPVYGIFDAMIILPHSNRFRHYHTVTVMGKDILCLIDFRLIFELGNELGGGLSDIVAGSNQKDIRNDTNHHNLVSNTVCQHMPGNIDRVIHFSAAKHHTDRAGCAGKHFGECCYLLFHEEPPR